LVPLRLVGKGGYWKPEIGNHTTDIFCNWFLPLSILTKYVGEYILTIYRFMMNGMANSFISPIVVDYIWGVSRHSVYIFDAFW